MSAQVKHADILIRCAGKNVSAPLKIEETLSIGKKKKSISAPLLLVLYSIYMSVSIKKKLKILKPSLKSGTEVFSCYDVVFYEVWYIYEYSFIFIDSKHLLSKLTTPASYDKGADRCGKEF